MDTAKCEPWQYKYVHDMLALYREAFAITKAGGRVKLFMTDITGMDLTEWRAEFMRALHRRINLKAGEPKWRKMDYSYQIQFVRDQYRLHDRINKRIRVYQFETREVRRRFGHLLSRYDEDW